MRTSAVGDHVARAAARQFVRAARELRVTLAAFPAFEVVYIVDLAQQSYGYAVNLQVPEFSEWGDAALTANTDARSALTVVTTAER